MVPLLLEIMYIKKLSGENVVCIDDTTALSLKASTFVLLLSLSAGGPGGLKEGNLKKKKKRQPLSLTRITTVSDPHGVRD